MHCTGGGGGGACTGGLFEAATSSASASKAAAFSIDCIILHTAGSDTVLAVTCCLE